MAKETSRKCFCSNCGNERRVEPGPCPNCGARHRTIELGLASEIDVAGMLTWVKECRRRIVRKEWLAVAILVGILSTALGLLLNPLAGGLLGVVGLILSIVLPPPVVLLHERERGGG